MFPTLRQRLSTARQHLGGAVLDRLDLVVELSTLGEYGLADDGRPLALGEPAGDPTADAPPRAGALAAARVVTAPARRSPRDDCPLRCETDPAPRRPRS